MGHSSSSVLRSSRGCPENVLGTPRINLPGTSLERLIRTLPGWSNRTFRGHPRDVGGYIFAGWEIANTGGLVKKNYFNRIVTEIENKTPDVTDFIKKTDTDK